MVRVLVLAGLMASTACAIASPVTFDFALVDNAGNAPDPQTGRGAVDYTYAISKTEVTRGQYTTFLNAVDPTGRNALELYNPRMFDNNTGIFKTGPTDGSRYVVQFGQENKPVAYVSFIDAMRFVNWLHNGQGTGDTESGVYEISNGLDEVRSPNAKFWIPSEDEWYKAAYHDASSGTAGVYFDYATGSNEEPISDSPEDNPAAVNYANDDGIANGFNDGYAVFTGRGSGTTDVGAYAGAVSPYGTFDQSGNLFEWNETIRSSSERGVLGGSWGSALDFVKASRIRYTPPHIESVTQGFRIATVPEPRAVITLVIGIGMSVFRSRPGFS